MNIEISEIQVVPVKPINGLVGFASIVFSNSFYIGSIGIHTRLDGSYRLTYPTKKSNLGNNMSLVYPINRQIADLVEKEVVKKFEEVMKSYARHIKTDAR